MKTDIREYLADKNIQFTEKPNSSGNQGIFKCPTCGDKNSFAINLDTGAYQCFRANKCGIKGSFRDFQKLLGDDLYSKREVFIKREKQYALPNVQPGRPDEEVYTYFSKRKISAETVKKFRIGLSGNRSEIMFPYFKDNQLLNVKYRNLNEKKFRKEKDCKSTLWNQDNVTSDPLIIVEGEIDCMSLWEYGIDSVSLPSGVNDMNWIEHDWEYINRFKEIILIMDNDKPGQSIIDNLVNRLGRWRCKNVILPVKDVNLCLTNGISKTEIQACIDNAQDFPLQELKHCDYYVDEIIEYKNNPLKRNGIQTGNEKLTDIIKGWRSEELSIWTGQNGSGKSTFLSQEIIHLLRQGEKCCIGSFEMPPRKYLWWLVKQSCKKENITDFEINETLDQFAENLFIIDVVGDIERNNLFEIIEYGCRKYDIKVYVIDSLMKVKLSNDNNRLYGEQKEFVNRLASLVKEFKCHIHLVAHPRKPKTDDYESDKADVAGSGDITNIADNVFLIYRYSEEQIAIRKKNNKEPYDSFIEVKKNREHGDLGKVGFYFNRDYKTFEDVQTVTAP